MDKRGGPGDQSGASGLEAATTSRFASFRVGSLAYFGENRDSYIAFHLLSDGPLAYSISLLTRKGRVLNSRWRHMGPEVSDR